MQRDVIEIFNGAISVVIPTLNEETYIADTISNVKDTGNVEIIVADGGSTDRTLGLAVKAGARVASCERGRSSQMNAGADTARGEILLFLHADTFLPKNWDSEVRNLLADTRVSLGAFRFKVRERLPGIPWVEWGANVRAKYFGRPYGDQALFLRKSTWRDLGGFPKTFILEDSMLVKRAKKYGKVAILPGEAVTSGRRWKKWGVLTTIWRNQLVLLGSLFGVSHSKLHRFYAGRWVS